MVWGHSGRMHWTSHDAAGLMMDVRIVKGNTELTLIDAITGEIIKTTQHTHPKDAMNQAKLIAADREVKHVEHEKISEKTKSKSTTSVAEAQITI